MFEEFLETETVAYVTTKKVNLYQTKRHHTYVRSSYLRAESLFCTVNWAVYRVYVP
jgi:hypothetical protein